MNSLHKPFLLFSFCAALSLPVSAREVDTWTRASDGKSFKGVFLRYDKLSEKAYFRVKGREVAVAFDTFDEGSKAMMEIYIQEDGESEEKVVEKNKELQASYDKVKDLEYIDLTSINLKWQALEEFAGETIFVKVEEDTFDFEKGSSSKHGFLTQTKGKSLWVESVKPSVTGFFKAYVRKSSEYSKVRGKNLSNAYVVFDLQELISKDRKFLDKVKK